jgi:hypothetical protein
VNCEWVIFFFDWDVARRAGLQFGNEGVRFVLLSRDLLRFTRNAKILSTHPTLCECRMFSCSRFLNNGFFHSHSESYPLTPFPYKLWLYIRCSDTSHKPRPQERLFSRFFRAEIT